MHWLFITRHELNVIYYMQLPLDWWTSGEKCSIRICQYSSVMMKPDWLEQCGICTNTKRSSPVCLCQPPFERRVNTQTHAIQHLPKKHKTSGYSKVQMYDDKVSSSPDSYEPKTGAKLVLGQILKNKQKCSLQASDLQAVFNGIKQPREQVRRMNITLRKDGQLNSIYRFIVQRKSNIPATTTLRSGSIRCVLCINLGVIRAAARCRYNNNGPFY